MLCPKCRKELEDGSAFCRFCGNRLDGEQEPTVDIGQNQTIPANNVTSIKKKSLKKIAIIAIVVAMIIAGCGGIYFYWNDPINVLSRELKSGNYPTAALIYEENSSDSSFKIRATEKMQRHIEELIADYQKGDTNFETVDSACKELGDIIDKESSATIRELQKSKDAYTQGVEAIAKKDYKKAIDDLGKVIESDTENFSKVEGLVAQAKTAYCEDIMAKVEASENTLSAYKELKSVDDRYATEDLMAKRDEIKTVLQAEIEKTAKDFFDKEQYTELNQYIAKIKTVDAAVIPSSVNTILKNAETAYVDGKLALAEEKAGAGNYDEAISILEGAKKEFGTTKFDTKIKEYNHTKNAAKLKELKGKITYKYDDMDKDYVVVPAGLSTRYLNLSYNRFLDVRLIVDPTNSTIPATFVLTVGFEQDDWIFMDKVTFDCDGKQFKWDVTYSDRETQVLGGGTISEWVSRLDSEPFSLLSGIDSRIDNMQPLIDAMRGASKVKVRFSGDGYRDVTISNSHIQQVVDLWDIYQLLKEDPTLAKELVG